MFMQLSNYPCGTSLQVGTPGGLGLAGYWAPMLAPFTNLAVSSLADFSARAPRGAPSRATNEGTHQQCFAQVNAAAPAAEPMMILRSVSGALLG